jgi:hypothetical protein
MIGLHKKKSTGVLIDIASEHKKGLSHHKKRRLYHYTLSVFHTSVMMYSGFNYG